MSKQRQGAVTVEDAIFDRMALAAANVLGVKDRIHYLDDDDAKRLRGVVLREFNDFAEFCVALVRASSDGAVSQQIIEMLEEIHGAVVPSG